MPLTSVDAIAAAITSGRIDALFVTGPQGERLETGSFHAFGSATIGAPAFAPIDRPPRSGPIEMSV